MAIKFIYLLLLFNFHLRLSVSGRLNSMESVPDLQKSMYKVIDGYPCVRLLNLSGVIGCSNPGREMVVAPIVRYENTIALSKSSAVLVPSDEIQSFFTRIWHDSSFAGNIAGVIVESENEFQNKSKGFSPAGKFPLAEFAPYQNTSYEWNPIGSGIMWNAYDFPVFLLSESSTLTLQEAAIKNEKNKKAYIADVAEFDLVMQTTKAGTHDSETCLKEETCLPLGGYSVWSSLPPINVSSSDQSKPIILTMASMDSASFFRDKSLGADSPLSGLISLLAAIDALSHVDGLDDLTKQLVFIFFTGESWGYLGSRRFLYELDLQSDAVSGLNNSLIEMANTLSTVFLDHRKQLSTVRILRLQRKQRERNRHARAIEIGSVGKGFNQGVKRFYTHTAEVSSATNETLKALKHAQDSMKSEHIIVSPANASNPGIPPSSLMAFLRKNSLTSGLVLEDFDSVFSNKFYHSHLDNISNINSSAIVAAASLVARTLYILASDNKNASGSALAAISVNVSLVEELMGCLLDCDPGLSCELVKDYISPTSTCPSHYSGVILDEPSSTHPGYVDDMSRFLWNFLADRTSIPSENASSSCSQGCRNKGAVCVREETDGKGVCVISTTRYVPAYSTRLKFESGTWTVLPPNSSDPMGMLDPVWTESNWNAIRLRVYTVQDAAYDHIVLVAGISVTVLAYLAIVTTRAVLTKALKRD